MPGLSPRVLRALLLCCAVALCLSAPLFADTAFNGQGEKQTDAYGYYYTITGGKFPTGPTPNGDNASGGTFRYITDDPAWGTTIDTWHKDDWFTDNAGFALTLQNGATTVYDNNGLENGTYGDYYKESGSHGTHGLYRGYSSSNNWDWIYAGYFKVEEATTFDRIMGYFDANGGAADPVPFDANSPYIRYRMNIWSNVAGDLLPVNTGSFAGDVFSTDFVLGSFAVADTGVKREFSNGTTDPISRLTFTLDTPLTLQPGIYWFSHDAQVVPEPATLSLMGLGLLGAAARRRRKAK
jgi:hypothetical protein